MTHGSVLVVEDTPEVALLLVTVLERAGHEVRAVGTAAACLTEVARRAPDVILLDLGLPDADGVQLCRLLRAETPAHVLMLTGRTDEVDLLVGLAVGADGYMTKPFSPREVVARVEAFLRRPPAALAPEAPEFDDTRAILRLSGLEVDEDSREVRVDGAAVALTRTEFDLLHALATRPGRVLQRRTLMREVWHSEWDGNLRLVEAHMSNLRRKLVAAGMTSPAIRTVRGIGYRMVA